MAARCDSLGPDSILEEELDVLKAIYIHELELREDENGHPFEVSLTLHPATGDDITIQFVCMTVVFKLPETYPDEPPDIIIKNPRGLAEEEVQRLQEDMHVQAKERCGAAMLYELIEMAKEILTEGNIPRCPCVVCLEHFHEGDEFTRTECYHYFHKACLARYVQHALSQQPELAVMHQDTPKEDSKLVCPVCRTEISYDLENLNQEPWDREDRIIYTPSKAMLRQQREMAELFTKQKAKGGIIDLEAEKTKYLVNEETVVTLNIEVPEVKQPEKKTASREKSGRKGSGRGSSRYENRNEKRDGNIVAKYKGFPKRDRRNDYNSSRKTHTEERSTRAGKGDNSKSSQLTSESRGHRDERDRPDERRSKSYGHKDDNFVNDGCHGPRSGDSYQNRIEAKPQERHEKDAFDHSNMGTEIGRIEKSTSHDKHSESDFKRRDNDAHERVTSPRYGGSNNKYRDKKQPWREENDNIRGDNSDHLQEKSLQSDDKNKDVPSERFESRSFGNRKYSRNRTDTEKPVRSDARTEREQRDGKQEESWDEELETVDKGNCNEYSNMNGRYRGNSEPNREIGRRKYGKDQEIRVGSDRKDAGTKTDKYDARSVQSDNRYRRDFGKGRTSYRDRQKYSESDKDDLKGRISSRGNHEEDWDEERMDVGQGKDASKAGEMQEDWDKEKIDVGSREDSGGQGRIENRRGHADRPRNNRREFHRHWSKDENQDFVDSRRGGGKGRYGNSRDWHYGNWRSTGYRHDVRENHKKASGLIQERSVEDWDKELAGGNGSGHSGYKKSQKGHVTDSREDLPSRNSGGSSRGSSISKSNDQLQSTEKHTTEKLKKLDRDSESNQSAAPPGVQKPPGIHVTGPPPGFDSGSRTVTGGDNSSASVKPPPGFR